MEGKREGSVRESCTSEIPFILSSCMYVFPLRSCLARYYFLFFSSSRRSNTDGATVRRIHLSKSNVGGKIKYNRKENWRFGRKKIFIINYIISYILIFSSNTCFRWLIGIRILERDTLFTKRITV